MCRTMRGYGTNRVIPRERVKSNPRTSRRAEPAILIVSGKRKGGGAEPLPLSHSNYIKLYAVDHTVEHGANLG
jgi:hypothetical protein